MKRPYLFFSASVFLMACQAADTPNPSLEAARISEGLSIVKTQCAFCHSIGASGESPRADAPPLRTVLANYNAESLADDFREHIHVGHPDMPDFDFGPKGTDEVIAYLKSIQETPSQ